MATLKRSDSKTLKEDPPPRACIICTEKDIPLVKPCRSCNTDYCEECLEGMFVAAVEDQTRMPPRCCHFLQIHTVIRRLDSDDAKAYRAKFEEWMAPVKLYCPSPKCSAFIPARKLPALEPALPQKNAAQSLSAVLREVVEAVVRSPSSRFFRDEMPSSQLPGYTKKIKRPMHLSMIQINVLGDVYGSTSELTADMKLIVKNAKEYNGAGHPVTNAADALFEQYLSRLATLTDRLAQTPPVALPPKFFPCPECHVAICTDCRQIEHSGSPCDTSNADHEMAMLSQFGYKQCPRCKAGVKKMYGCSHMACICGAHWCYYCQRSIDLCDGGCGEGPPGDYDDDEEDDNESDYDEDGDLLPPAIFAERDRLRAFAWVVAQRRIEEDTATPEVRAMVQERAPMALVPNGARLTLVRDHGVNVAQIQTQAAAAATVADARGGAPDATQPDTILRDPGTPFVPPNRSTSTASSTAPPVANPQPAAPSTATPTAPLSAHDRIVNLDAGGGRRWAQRDLDFGDEPEDDGVAQVWSCRHDFEPYKSPPEDGFNCGDLTRMECNRCFERVELRKEPPKKGPNNMKKRKVLAIRPGRLEAVPEGRSESQEDAVDAPGLENEAHECKRCRVVVCVGCRVKYIEERDDD
ncbi:uncharacterized protein LTR77_002465 [Saxophila tyrrhenica]|uniref:RING-type domain-containing protein n=1 Tax=Saxophila tyrrhenica TaxID=1690608 RepID=A0AAV9PJK6_9PEZI|nr:hypothetical protein LTR77_002465 [Saxophila tyrrhenica]